MRREDQHPTLNVLSPPAPIPAANQAAPVLGSVAVREFDAPVFLKGGPIVYRESPAQLGFYDYHRWAADPRLAVTSTAIQDMQSRAIFRSVDPFDGRASDCVMTGRSTTWKRSTRARMSRSKSASRPGPPTRARARRFGAARRQRRKSWINARLQRWLVLCRARLGVW